MNNIIKSNIKTYQNIDSKNRLVIEVSTFYNIELCKSRTAVVLKTFYYSLLLKHLPKISPWVYFDERRIFNASNFMKKNKENMKHPFLPF